MPELQKMHRAGPSLITQLTSDISASEQSIPVANASYFPDGENYATIGTDNGYESILYTGVDTANNLLTGCQRGQPGTPAKAWTMGAYVYHAWAAGSANAIMNNIDSVNQYVRLSPATATALDLGLDPETDPTLNDAFAQIATQYWNKTNLDIQSGTWVPSFTESAVEATVRGVYYKAGRLVCAYADFNNISNAPASSRMIITGYPFAISDPSLFPCGLYIRGTYTFPSNFRYPISDRINSNSIRLDYITDNIGSTIPGLLFNGVTRVQFTAIYLTD